MTASRWPRATWSPGRVRAPGPQNPLSATGPTSEGAASGTQPKVSRQFVAQYGVGQQFAEQRPELHQVAADERDDTAPARHRPAVAAGVEPRGADGEAVHPARGRERR